MSKITANTVVCVTADPEDLEADAACDVVTLGDMCECNELDLNEAIAALEATGEWRIDAGGNGQPDVYVVTVAD